MMVVTSIPLLRIYPINVIQRIHVSPWDHMVHHAVYHQDVHVVRRRPIERTETSSSTAAVNDGIPDFSMIAVMGCKNHIALVLAEIDGRLCVCELISQTRARYRNHTTALSQESQTDNA